MSSADSTQSTRRHRRFSKGQVRSIEYSRRAVVATESVTRSYAAYVGRVGALAVALGVGSAVASVPVAFADTTGSGGSSGSSGSSSASSSASSATTPSPSRGRAGRGGSAAGASAASDSPDGSSAGRRGPGSSTAGSDSDAPPAASGRGSSDRSSVGGAGPTVRHPRPSFVVPGVAGAEGVGPGSVAVPSSDSSVDFVVPVVDSAAAVSDGSPAPADGVASPVVGVASPAAAAAPVMSATPRAAAGGVRGVSGNLLAWLGAGGSGDSPAAVPLAWTVAAASRREIGRAHV